LLQGSNFPVLPKAWLASCQERWKGGIRAFGPAPKIRIILLI